MIVETSVDLFFSILTFAFSSFEIIGLPMQAINTLATISVYGVWIVGADILAIFASTIIMWWTFKFIAGLIVWLWELLPLT